MRRSVLPLIALVLLVELVFFRYLPAAPASLLLALHGVVIVTGFMAAPRAPVWRHVLPIALIGLGCGLFLLEARALLWKPSLAPKDAVVTQAAVERDTADAKSALRGLLASQRALVRDLPEDLFSPERSRVELFERLTEFRNGRPRDRDDVAVTMYGSAGEALAWVGETSVLDAPESRYITPTTRAQFVHREPLGTRLYTVRVAGTGSGARFAVSEVLLDAPFDPEAWRRRVVFPARMTSEVRAEFLEPRQADTSLRNFLNADEDQYWTRGRGSIPELIAALRGDSGDMLALLTLHAESPAAAAARRARGEGVLRLTLYLAALAVCLTAGVIAWRAFGAGSGELANLALLLLGLRTALGALGPFMEGEPVADYRIFSFPLPLDLGRSPWDALLTCLALVGLITLLAIALRRAPSWGRAVATVLGILIVTILFRVTPSWVSDSSLNLARSPFLPPQGPRFALGWAHAAIAFSAAVMFLTAIVPRRRALSVRTFAATWLVASAGSYLLLAWQANKVPAVLIETALAPEVLEARNEQADRLRDFLVDAQRDSRWEPMQPTSGDDIDRIVFDVWRTSELGKSGLRSALAVMDTSGRLLGSFAYGLPDRIFLDTVSAGRRPPRIDTRPGASPVETDDELVVLGLHVSLLRGDIALFHDRQPIGRLVALLSREWDNLPLLTLRDPLLRTLGAGRDEPTFDEYFGGAPLYIAYSSTGEVLFPSAERAAPLAPGQLGTRSPVWTKTTYAGDEYRTYLFPAPDGLRSLGYISTSAITVAAGTIRALASGLGMLALFVAIVVVMRVPNIRRAFSVPAWAGFFTGSYYRRLLAVVLASSLLPLGLLTVIFRNSIEQQSRDAFERAGVQAAGTIRRLLEDYVASAESDRAESDRAENDRAANEPAESNQVGNDQAGRHRTDSDRTVSKSVETESGERERAESERPETHRAESPLAKGKRAGTQRAEGEQARTDGAESQRDRAAAGPREPRQSSSQSSVTQERVTAQPAPIESRTLFWVGRRVNQDIHLFDADRLAATSRGDPESSGLRTFRLSPEVARALALNRPPQFLSKDPLPGRHTALVYAPMRLRKTVADAVLAVPLVLQERDLGRQGDSVADALLTATFCLGFLLLAVGYVFARRLSVPIGELGHAAGEVAEGRLDVRVKPRGRDEIRQLVDAFNSMTGALAQQREDLERRKDYIEAILLNITTGVISTSADGIVRTGNPAASLLLGLPVDLVGRNLFEELGAPSELEPLLAFWREALPGPPSATPREISIRRDGEEVRVRTVVLPIAGSEGSEPGRIFLVEDVTEVMRSNRLAAWAEMARRIAHEIKNPLTPIQLSAEHLLRIRSDGSEEFDGVLRECVTTILDQVRTLREISSDFSTYSRLPVLRRQATDLPELLRSTISPYRTAMPAGIRIHEKIERLPPLSVDSRALRGAIVNLVENALQAMEGGGDLTVSLRRRTNGSVAVAEIEIADTGVGMDEETRARVFEPYFSTRDSGIGLGLAIARRAVEEHGGTLSAESEPGKGTRMIVRLPIGEPAPAGTSLPTRQDSPEGSE